MARRLAPLVPRVSTLSRDETTMEMPNAVAHESREAASPSTSAARVLKATATFWLSEAGRKTALLRGQDARARQDITIDVSIARLHLVSVDAAGVARLKLRPRYERDKDQEIVCIDAAPTYDTPPTLDQLLADAARNFELGGLYEGMRRAVRDQRDEAERDLRDRFTQAFLADPTQRALPHPAPSPTRCFVLIDGRRRLFDSTKDEGIAREVPREAHKRFRADLRARREKNQQAGAAQRALHDAKREAIAIWIEAHGTPDQQARQRAGVLPFHEAIDAMTDVVFAPLRPRPLYERNGAADLQRHLRATLPAYADVMIAPSDLSVSSSDATTATRAQWALLEELRAAIPSATVTLRAHRLSWRRDSRAPSLAIFSVSVIVKEGLFTLRREFTAPD